MADPGWGGACGGWLPPRPVARTWAVRAPRVVAAVMEPTWCCRMPLSGVSEDRALDAGLSAWAWTIPALAGSAANWGCARRRRASPAVRSGSARGPVDKETQRADGPHQRHAMGDEGSERELRRTCDGWRHQRSGKACSGTAGRVTRGFRLSGHCIGAIRSRGKPSHGEPGQSRLAVIDIISALKHFVR